MSWRWASRTHVVEIIQVGQLPVGDPRDPTAKGGHVPEMRSLFVPSHSLRSG